MTATSSEVSIWAVLSDVATERRGQDARWGEQNHPDVHASRGEAIFPGTMRNVFYRQAESWKATNEARVRRGVLSWDGILLEEVYEALTEAAEGDDARLYAELVQVAAVATCWAEAVKRRKENDPDG